MEAEKIVSNVCSLYFTYKGVKPESVFAACQWAAENGFVDDFEEELLQDAGYLEG